MGSVLQVNPTTPESATRKLCYKLPPFLSGIGTKKNGWDNKHPSRSYCGYPYNHRRLLK
ncbi:hypothetical protein CICLE_v10004111mg [Citrus x clementina]|uniref:Uncharacterized protein n=1 Tax=Citrus clementina TaxID=85681 RepID=V4TYT8_CITCL|nr:hypothetical protein CICLE_v10004111mg [Citrus x clementina]